jgi:hypothetical protein
MEELEFADEIYWSICKYMSRLEKIPAPLEDAANSITYKMAYKLSWDKLGIYERQFLSKAMGSLALDKAQRLFGDKSFPEEIKYRDWRPGWEKSHKNLFAA